MTIRAEIRFRAKTIVTSFSRDIDSDRPKINIIKKFSLCVINVLLTMGFICFQIVKQIVLEIQRWKVSLQKYWVEPP